MQSKPMPAAADVKSVRRTAEVIEMLARTDHPLRLGEIASALNLPKSSTHALLHTLVAQEVLTVDDEGGFSLSLAFVGRMAASFDRLDIRAVARPAMERLSRTLGVTCNLGVLEGGNIVYVEQVRDGSHPVQLATRIGVSIPAHMTALGKVLVGELDAARQSAWLDAQEYTRQTEHTVGDATAMRVAIEDSHRRGFAVDDEELLDGIYCVAAPVRDRRDVAVAAVSITSFKASMREQTANDPNRFTDAVLQAAGEISAAMGARPRVG